MSKMKFSDRYTIVNKNNGKGDWAPSAYCAKNICERALNFLDAEDILIERTDCPAHQSTYAELAKYSPNQWDEIFDCESTNGED